MNIRRKIMPDVQVAQLVRSLQDLPDEIERQKNLLAAKEFEVSTWRMDEELEERIKEIEATATFEILNETGADGKKKYANEAQREAALTAILSKSEEWTNAKNEWLHAKRGKAQLQFDLAKVRNSMSKAIDRYYTLKSIAEIVAGLSHEQETTKRIEIIARAESLSAPVRTRELENDTF